jgi:transcriptional regulator with XRE-family HTH domain
MGRRKDVRKYVIRNIQRICEQGAEKHGNLKRFAEKSGLGYTHIQKFARCKIKDPRISTLEKFSAAAKVDVESILK